MGPINYGVEVATPFQAAIQGYQVGDALQGAQVQRQAKQLALQAEQTKQDQQRLMQRDLYQLSNNPAATGADYAATMTRYPQLGESLKRSWDVLNTEQRENKLAQGTQAYAAILSGKPQVAADLFRQRAAAARQSGAEDDAKQADTMAEFIAANPQAAGTSMALSLAAGMGPEKFASTFETLGKERRATAEAPADLALKNAQAAKAGTEAGIVQATAPAVIDAAGLKNEQTAEEIRASQAKQRIDELSVQISQADSETKRGQLALEREKLIAAQGEKRTTEAGAAQEVLDTVQAGRNVISQIRSHPALEGFFTGAGTVLGKVSGLVPGTDRKDLEALVDTLKSQQFLAGVAKLKAAGGAGALSDAEGKKIDSAIASINLDMSPKALKNALGVIESSLGRLEKVAVGSGKLSNTSQTFVAKVPGIGNVTDGMVNQLLRQHPGATREQAMQFLQSQQGGK